jgi:conjugative transposon TraN protein
MNINTSVMKRNLWVIILVFVCLLVDLKAQKAKSFAGAAIIEPFKLEVSYNKTTHLVFPLSIISIDRGSAGILAQKATGVENILKVKADKKDFEETNLSVITSDGKLYSFLVCYNGNPAYLNVNVDSVLGQPSLNELKQKASGTFNEALMSYYTKLALHAGQNLHGVKTTSAKASIHLEGVYVKENALFLRLQLRNRSAINYDIDQLRLFVRDKVQTKRTAIQEKEVEPTFIEGNSTAIRANSTQSIVLAVPAFTVPKEKYMVIEMTEKGGGRNLLLKVKSKLLLKAQPLD